MSEAKTQEDDFIKEDYDNPLKQTDFIHGDETKISPVDTRNQTNRYWISNYALNRINKNQNYMLLITGGTGCQPKGSKVLMANGDWKNIEDIKLGDLVLSPQENGFRIESKVLKTYEWDCEMCFQLVNYKGEVLYECSDNHEIPHKEMYSNNIVHTTAKELWGKHIYTYDSNLRTRYVEVIPKNPKARETVYGFTLDSKSSWYITDNLMITKNSGKSYSAMEIALDIDPSFTDKRIVFTAMEFINLLINEKPPPRSVIVWDEVGVELSSRSWWSAQNRMMGFLFETFRRDNLILIMTTPNVSFIDKKIRSMLHGYMEIIDPSNASNKFGRAKYYNIMLNLMEGKTYYQFPRTIDEFGRTRTLRGRNRSTGNMRFEKPPDYIIDPYEIRKKALVEKVKMDTFDTLSGKKEKTRLSIRDVVAELQNNPRLYKMNLDEEMITKGQLISHVNVMLSMNFPDLKMSKGDVKDAVEFVILSEGFGTGNDNKIKDDEIDTIKRLFQMYTGNVNKVAKAVNISHVALGKRIKKWTKEGVWNTKEIMETEYV